MSESISSISPLRAFHDEATDLRRDTPPPTEWQAGVLRFHEQLQALRERVGDRLQELLDTLDRDLFDALQSAAHEAAAIHTALVKTSHFDDPVDEVPPHLRWSRVRDYRRDTMTRVLAPLRSRLAELDLGVALEAHWQAFWDDMAALPPHLPVSITRPEPQTLYAPSPEDGPLVALRKRLVLARRYFRRDASPMEDRLHAQDVPLRALAAYHLRVRLPDRLEEHERAIHQELARAVATFERSATMWTHRLLDAERHLDRPTDHLSERPELSFPDTSQTAQHASPLAAADVWAAVNAEAEALDKQLRTLSGLDFTERSDEVTFAVQTAWSALEADTDQADSFLLRRKDRTIPAAPLREDEANASWAAWHRQAVNRLAFCETLATLHDTAYEHEEDLLDALIEAAVEPLTTHAADAVQALRALHQEAAALFDDAPPLETRRARLRTLRDRATQIAETRLAVPLQAWPADRRIEEIDAHLARPGHFVGLSPASFRLHALAPSDAETIAPDAATRDVNLQAIAQRHFDAFFADPLRHSLARFYQQVQKVANKANDVPALLRADFDAALKALEAASSEEAETVATARALAVNGLAHAAETVETQTERTLTAFSSLAAAVARTFTTTLTDLHDRARVESRIRERLFDLPALATHDARDPAPARPERLPRAARTCPYPALPPDDDGDDRALGDLPLVYQRLFAFRPVLDPDLLVGRRDDLARLKDHLDRWTRGARRALVLTGLPGSGRTSFLNVAQKTLLRHADVRRITLDERLQSESAFAECLAQTLDLPLSATDGGPLMLDQIRAHLLSHPRRADEETPRVCIVEHLEHLFVRAIRGTDLARRVLTFMGRTASQVLWIATASEYGWPLLDKMAPTALQLVQRHRLAPIDRSTLETLIMTRHRRSGLPLTFEPPEAPDPQLRRRLRRARTTDARQSVLQTAYFDRLHAQCGFNIRLALFYWTRSVSFDDEALAIRVAPLQPLDFGFLEDLSLPAALLLRAFLEHTTLTPEAYGEVARLPLDQSLSLFELLGSTRLLQATDATADNAHAPVEPGRRYRLHPLAIHPVTEHLREERLLH